MTQRPVSRNLEAERSVLGGILIENTMFAVAAATVKAGTFSLPENGRIFECFTQLAARNEPIDLVTVKEELERAGDLDRVGGPAYIASLVDGVPRSTNVRYYAEVVREHEMRRRLGAEARRLAQDAVSTDDVPGLIARTTIALQDLQQPGLPRVKRDRVERELERLRANQEAKRLLLAETRGAGPELVIATLRERLSRPRTAPKFSILGWLPAGGRVVLSAQFKAGKTTLVGSYIRSKVDGDPFLGRDPVTVTAGTVVLLDFEMSEYQLDDWLAAQGIRNDDRVIVVPMRGHAHSFDIMDAQTRTKWAKRLRDLGATDLCLDCLRPILDAIGLDEHHDAGRFLVAVDALLVEAGISDCLVVHHMGHKAERSRGDSRIRDWPDVEWRLVREDKDDPASARFISAYGRDVEQPEQRLAFDANTRRLTLVGGSRRDGRLDAAVQAVRGVLKDSTGAVNASGIKKALKGGEYPRDAIDRALRDGEKRKFFIVRKGPKNSKLYEIPAEAELPASGEDSARTEVSVSEFPAPSRDPETRKLVRDNLEADPPDNGSPIRV